MLCSKLNSVQGLQVESTRREESVSECTCVYTGFSKNQFLEEPTGSQDF